MSIKKRVREARNKATLDAVLAEYQGQQEMLSIVDAILKVPYQLELAAFYRGDSIVLVFPFPTKREMNALERSIYEGVAQQLGSDAAPQSFSTYRGLALDRKELLQKMQISAVNGLEFTVEITTFKHPGISAREPATQNSRPYVPPTPAGTKFDVRLDIGKERGNGQDPYVLLRWKREDRIHLPGFKMPFKLVYHSGDTITHVTSASKETLQGALAGNYITTGIRKLIRHHPELNDGALAMRVIEPGKTYELLTK